MSRRSATYYMAKCINVVDWIRRGKEEEIRLLGRVTGPSAEIIKAEMALLDELKHIFSSTETLNVFFKFAVTKADPITVRPSLFHEYQKTPAVTRESLKALIEGLESKDDSAISKAIEIIRLVDRFLAK